MRQFNIKACIRRIKHYPKLVIAVAFLVVFYVLKKVVLDLKSYPDIEAGNIVNSKVQPENGNNIFFIESGDSSKIELNSRQACAIESAALMNPHLKVFVLYASNERLNKLTLTPEVEAFWSYPNVFVNYINVNQLSIGSPMEEFIRSEKLSSSSYKVEHTADVLRFLVLWRFGGTYIDLDVIVRQRLDSFSNYACPESNVYINNAILNFDTGTGRNISEIFIKSLIENFDGREFVTNGPVLLTSVLRKLCQVIDLTKMTDLKDCQGFHVLKREFCYPIIADEWKLLWDENKVEDVMDQVKNSLVVHFWNSRSKHKKLKKSSKAAYISLAKQFCPKVMASRQGYF